MDDSLFLKKCLDLIENKIDRGSREEWTNGDFKKLADKIEESSDIRISSHTLKRLYGKVSYKGSHNPQDATKDALAIFLGYGSWDEFTSNNKEEKHYKIPSIQKPAIKKNQIWWLVAGIIIIGVLSVVFTLGSGKVHMEDVVFNVENPVGNSPHTVKVNYDFSKISSKNIFIDFDHFSNGENYLIYQIRKDKGSISQCFHFPGYYDIKLFIDEELEATYPVLIKSDGWFSYAIDARPVIDDVPRLTKSVWYKRYYKLKFDNIINDDVVNDGFLHVPQSALDKIEGLTANYKVHHIYLNPINASLDNCIFELRFRNEKFGEGINCDETSIEVIGREGSVQFQIVEPGCYNYAYFRVGKNSIFGQSNDMSNFQVEYKDFITIKMKVANNHIQLFKNDEIFHEADYDGKLSDVLGFHIMSKGSPTIDWVKLSDLDHHVEYEDDFNDD